MKPGRERTLTEQEILDCKHLRWLGWTYRELAGIAGVHPSTMRISLDSEARRKDTLSTKAYYLRNKPAIQEKRRTPEWRYARKLYRCGVQS